MKAICVVIKVCVKGLFYYPEIFSGNFTDSGVKGKTQFSLRSGIMCLQPLIILQAMLCE